MMQQPPMPSVRAWLESIGMMQYADLFEQQEIDFDLLTELTDEALQKLGIAVLGHRLRLMKAIATLNGRPTGRPDSGVSGEYAARIGVLAFGQQFYRGVNHAENPNSRALRRRGRGLARCAQRFRVAGPGAPVFDRWRADP